MNDQEKTKDGLISELVELRQRVASQGHQLVRSQQAATDQRQINNSLPVLVATAGFDGYYKEVNAAFERILGWSEQESLSRPFTEFIHPEDRVAAVETFARLKSGEPAINFLDRNICKDGSHRWINWTVIPVPDRDIVFGIGQDITEKKLAETVLRESEECFRGIFDEGPLGVVLATLDGRIQRVNRRFCDQLGYSEQEIIELGIEGFSHPDDYRIDAQLAERLLAGEIPRYTIDKRLLRKDGQVVWGQVTVSLLRDALRKPTHAIGMTEDITERKRTEEALRQAHDELEQKVKERTVDLEETNRQLRSEADKRKCAEESLAKERTFLRQVIDTTPVVILVKDREGRYVLGNEAAARFFRSTVQDMVGQTDYDLLLHQDADTNTKIVTQQTSHNETDLGVIQSQQRVAQDVQVTDANGQPHWFMAFKTPVIEPDGTCNRMLIGAIDVTQRRQAEEALRESEARYKALVEASPDTVVLADLRGNLTFVSRGILELHGSESLAGFIGKHAMDFIVPEDHGRFQANLQRTLQEGVTRNIEYTFVRRDGTRFPGEVSGAVIRDASGKPTALMGVVRDVTERKRAEDRVKAEQRALRRMVLASDHERRLITYELHDGVAQQLLGAMLLFQSQVPRKGRKSQASGGGYRDGIRALHQASSELRRVMNWLRTPVLEKFGVVEAIEDAVAQLRLTHRAPEIKYRHAVEFKRLEPTLENTLFRIAQEAMANACRHSKSEKVRVKLTQKGDDVTLEVRDWGVGFDQDTVQENRFGLEGVRERARVMGGKLSIKSEPGKETVVQVKFPVIEATVGEA
jgi:PAS domain S-box-containing protein